MISVGVLYTGTDPEVPKVLIPTCLALVKQANEHLAPMWGLAPIVNMRVLHDEAQFAADEWRFYVRDVIDVPDALADHYEQGGLPMLEAGWHVIRDNGGTLTSGPTSLSSAMSHELLEALVDPYASFYARRDDGPMIALECADPVQGDAYDVTSDAAQGGDVIAVSNFVGPRWFRQGPGPFDFLGRVTSAFAMTAGGYIAKDDGTQEFGDAVPAWQRELKARLNRRVRAGRVPANP